MEVADKFIEYVRKSNIRSTKNIGYDINKTFDHICHVDHDFVKRVDREGWYESIVSHVDKLTYLITNFPTAFKDTYGTDDDYYYRDFNQFHDNELNQEVGIIDKDMNIITKEGWENKVKKFMKLK